MLTARSPLVGSMTPCLEVPERDIVLWLFEHERVRRTNAKGSVRTTVVRRMMKAGTDDDRYREAGDGLFGLALHRLMISALAES